MRLCLVLAVALLPGCLVIKQEVDGKFLYSRTYLGPIPLSGVRKTPRLLDQLDESDNEAEKADDAQSQPVVRGPKVRYNPIRPFGSTVVAQEAVVVTADDPNLHYPNGETVPVELGDSASMTFIRTVGKARNGELYVDYDFDPADAPQTASVPEPVR